MPKKTFRQANAEKKAKKAAKNERRNRQRRCDLRPSFALMSGMEEAEQQLGKGELYEAAEILEELARRYPRRLEVLEMLLEVYFQQRDMWSYQSACQRLVKLAPDSADSWLSLAGAALSNEQMATAHWAFGHVLNRWSDHAETDDARETYGQLKQLLQAEGAKYGMRSDDRDDLLLLHDDINFHLQQGDYDRVVEVAGQLLARCPTFAPALNNRSEAQFRSDKLGLAIADVRRVLEFDAGNFQALSNLARYLFISGQTVEAREVSARLKAAESDSPALFVKQAESFGIIGDWQGVLDALEQFKKRGAGTGDGDIGLLYHLAGVAAAELGRLDDARRHWNRAIKLGPVADWSQQNIEDLKLPPGEQNGPWAFPIEQWIPKATLERLIADMERGGESVSNAGARRRMRMRLEQHSYLEKLAPLLLERGDATTKEFVIRVLSLGQTPPILEALREFAFGRRGSDKLRHAAAVCLTESGTIEPGMKRLWIQGELRDINMMSFEIISEPVGPLPKNVQQLAQDAWESIHDEDGAAAESMLNKAIDLCPNDPSLEFNRVVAIRLQRREAEALTLVRDLHSRHPDYLFARVTLAEEAIKRHEFRAARDLLDPLLSRRRFHLSEYTAMCHAHIALLFAEGEREGARAWLKMWQDVAPDDERAEYWHLRLNKQGLLSRYFK